MSQTSSFLRPRGLIPIAHADLNANDATQRSQLGELSFVIDAFGFRAFRYVKNVRGSALVLGDVAQRVADVTVASITSGTTTSITKTSGFTANANAGKILIYETNNTSAGTAPEGESAIISSNTADVLTLDPLFPLSAAPNAADAIRITAPWHADIASASTPAENVLGVVAGSGGIDNGNFGWVQCFGYCPVVKTASNAAIAQGAQVITGSGTLVTIGAAGQNKVCGYSVATIASTNAGKYPFMLTLLGLGAVNN